MGADSCLGYCYNDPCSSESTKDDTRFETCESVASDFGV